MAPETTAGTTVEAMLAAEGKPFHPLGEVVLVDDFEDSRCGWYNHHIDREPYDADWGVVCRSTMPTHWWGSYGSQTGHYSLKVATTPEAGTVSRAIKRLTMPYHSGEWYSRLRFEAFFTYHEEPRGTTVDTEVRPDREDLTGESNVRGFTFEFDLHDRDHRWWPAIRYHNFQGEDRRARWQYNDGGIDPRMDDFTDVPDGQQDLCWNSPNDSVPWKPNWHYFRLDIDADDYGYTEMQCNDAVYDLRDLDHEPSGAHHDDEDDRMTPWPDIDGLLNPIMSVQTNADTRSFLFVDALVLSAEEP